MIWVFIVLDILLTIACCIAYWYRYKWIDSEKLSQRRMEACEELCNQRDALGVGICEMQGKHKSEISRLNIQLENERFSKGVFEQRWKNAEEELMKTRDMLPKRDSKGRYCKKN